jgi:riboflavin kinase / FMN adenylyltransferase
MRIVRGLPPVPPEAPPSAVALGVFDGVHLGHRAILGLSVSRAREADMRSVACTFDPHPMEVLHPGRAPLPITTLEERLALIEGCGLEATVVLPFTRELAAMEPEAFVKDVLVTRFGARDVVVGFNHRFGRGARGDAAMLRSLGERLGFRTHVAEPLMVDGVAVSSTEIRGALQRGDLAVAARLLGRSYTLSGTIGHGAGRGRTLGFPTANVVPTRPVLVAPGVYACTAEVAGRKERAVVNVGVRPTFGETTLAVEAYLLDFSGDIYGQTMTLTFVSRIREERRFPSVDALRAQIEADAAEARSRL